MRTFRLLGGGSRCLCVLLLSRLILNDLLDWHGQVHRVSQATTKRHASVGQGVGTVLLAAVVFLAAALGLLLRQLAQLLLDALLGHSLDVLQVLGGNSGTLQGHSQRDTLNLYLGWDLGHLRLLFLLLLVLLLGHLHLVGNGHCDALQLDANLGLLIALILVGVRLLDLTDQGLEGEWDLAEGLELVLWDMLGLWGSKTELGHGVLDLLRLTLLLLLLVSGSSSGCGGLLVDLLEGHVGQRELGPKLDGNGVDVHGNHAGDTLSRLLFPGETETDERSFRNDD